MTEIIVAFDVSSRESAMELLAQFDEPIYVKIGMEAVYSMGTDWIHEIKQQGHRIFLDLKLHDIPNTVYHAIKALAKLDIDMVNVHAAGGVEMMKAAVRAVKEVNPKIKCIAVTLLTSLDETAVSEELSLSLPTQKAVLHYAQNALKAGMDGVVCSVHEVKDIHALCGEQFDCVTPGIIYHSNASVDQKRVATPSFAKEQGSNYIVVGRSITTSSNPYQTYLNIKGEL